jgi:arylsulfatase A-like enzyme
MNSILKILDTLLPSNTKRRTVVKFLYRPFKEQILAKLVNLRDVIKYRIKYKMRGDFKYEKLTPIKRNCIFIVIDCLRKDHISLYGYNRKTTPFLDSVAKHAAVFPNALTAASWTHSSVASILTGLYPHTHGSVFLKNLRNWQKDNFPAKLKKNVVTLPEILNSFYYKTAFFSSIHTAALPINGKFQHFYLEGTTAEELIAKCTRWLSKLKNKKFFIYLHLSDLHGPQFVASPHRDVFGKVPDGLPFWAFGKQEVELGDPSFETYKINRIKTYDAALRFVDNNLSILFSYLKKLELIDSTYIFITADHGEEFWDHAQVERELFYDPRGYHGIGHGHSLFQEIVNVPLLVFGPEISKGRYNHLVSLVDIVPTVLEHLRIKTKLDFDGLNLFNPNDDRIILSEDIAFGYEKKAVFWKNFKLIISEGDNIDLLFDIVNDPEEEKPINNNKIISLLKSKLPISFLDDKDREQIEINTEVEKKLRELGYL